MAPSPAMVQVKEDVVGLGCRPHPAGRFAQWEAGLDGAAVRGGRAGRDPDGKGQCMLDPTQGPRLHPLKEKLHPTV